MSRLMSVAYTEDAVVERRKTVSRRLGWWQNVRGKQLILAGDHLTLCRKVMGRKPGEPLVRLCDVEVLDVRRELLDDLLGDPEYGAREMELEGFPGMDPAEFIQTYFVEAQRVIRSAHVTRIEWKYLDDKEADGG